MVDIQAISVVAKKRARKVFAAFDSGVAPEFLWQPKLRFVTKDGKRLYYNWRAHPNAGKREHTPEGFRAFVEVRRDSLQRLYVKEVDVLPPGSEENHQLLKEHPEGRYEVSDSINEPEVPKEAMPSI